MSTICFSGVCKNRRWSSDFNVVRKENLTYLVISVRTNERIRVKLNLLALDIPVTSHQAIAFLSLKPN